MKITKILYGVGLVGLSVFSGYYYQKYNFNTIQFPQQWIDFQQKKLYAFNQGIYFTVYLLIGVSNLKIGRHQQAIKAFSEALIYNPREINTHFFLFSSYFEAQQYEEALKLADLVFNSDMYDQNPYITYLKNIKLIKIPIKKELLLWVKQEYFEDNK
ncbi:RNA polymerase I-associated factor PAF67 (macronuclear) [Tetrahymena thermophila SB210]|uniref:RNA polymerase I-associated factor PAF67 n=1 Tax=Tetrahymena thermophila (strain SB210) TaxID=312017 RepID=I7MCL1_TETTS|nr:RNA polymerase I-associated factor PAF67 [Tetrahymena thermophila SB210]EAR84152.1 RNA polymerase I-associated factor PAF67 [Tetrahymena thermophila SB210]|eukprot:XP_001031815.1 RNA polymerase I-associated factor PAF67 [Tetrahymena thermophila SB210]